MSHKVYYVIQGLLRHHDAKSATCAISLLIIDLPVVEVVHLNKLIKCFVTTAALLCQHVIVNKPMYRYLHNVDK